MYVVGGGNYPIKDEADEEDCLNSLNSRIRHFMDDYKKKIHSVDGDYVEPEDLSIWRVTSMSLVDTNPYKTDWSITKTERMENQKNLV